MRKKLAISLSIALVLVGYATTAAFGGSFSWGLGSLIATGWLGGLGNSPAEITLTAQGVGWVICENNGGGQAPGRNPVYFDVVSGATWYTDENGRADGSIEVFEPEITSLPVSPSPKDAGCPSDTWTIVGLDTSRTDWYAANITAVSLDTGKVVFNQDYTCTTYKDADGVNTSVDCFEVP